LPNRRVEWVIAEGSVGDIIEVDESGWRASRGYKMDNHFAVTHTNNGPHVLTRGNDDPSDDISLDVGQTWCVITSPIEGTTHIIAYAPGIYDWQKHKVFVQKHWLDVEYKLPPDATNRVGTPHGMGTCVMRNSDKAPLAGYEVTYRILDGPAARLQPGNGQSTTVTTGSDGMANVTLVQEQPVEGVNTVEITVVRPAQGEQNAITLGVGTMRKTWLAPAIQICKKAPREVYLGDQFTYALKVMSPGRMPAENVQVVDNLPEGIQYVSSDPPASVSGQQLRWSLGTLGVQEARDLRITVASTRTGLFTNHASVTADMGLSDQNSADTRVVAANLVAEKVAPEEVVLCDPIDYRVVVRNDGDSPARNVRLDEQLPDGLIAQGGRTRVVADLGTLAPGQSKSVTFQARAQRTGTFTNTVNVSGERGLTAQASAQTVVRQPVLAITQNGPAQRYLGREITYQITVRNTGDAPARNTVLTDAIPAGASFVRADSGGQLSGGQVTWQLGTLQPNAAKTVSVTFRGNQIGTLRNLCAARAVCAEITGEATTEVAGIPAILLECVDTDDPIEVGQQTGYLITVTNQGSANATGVVITCTLPAEEQLVSANGPTAHTVSGQTVTFASLATLTPKSQATYRVVVKGTQAGDVRFKVSLTANEMDSPVSETESTRFYE